MPIFRPNDRPGGAGKFKIEDGERNGSRVDFEANQRTRVRAPEPAYRTTKDEQFAYQVGAVGRAKAAAGIR